jgi:hypothetical protein
MSSSPFPRHRNTFAKASGATRQCSGMPLAAAWFNTNSMPSLRNVSDWLYG